MLEGCLYLHQTKLDLLSKKDLRVLQNNYGQYIQRWLIVTSP